MHYHSTEEYSGPLKKITWIGIFVNIVLSIVKIVLGLFGGSHAVFADGVHSLSDLATDFSVLLGVDIWVKKPDEEHPYGHELIENVITFALGFVLFAIGISIGFKAVISLKDMTYHQPRWIAFWAAFFSIVCKEILYRKTIFIAKKINSSALTANAWHHRSDAMSSIPVLIAVCVAIIKPDWAFIDNIGALIVAVFIVSAGMMILKGPCDVFIGKGCGEKTRKHIYDIALSVEGVCAAHALRTRIMGTHILADIHIEVAADISVREGHAVSSKVKEKLLDQVRDLVDVVIHIEPYEK